MVISGGKEWQCVCGKRHKITGDPITCVGKGHSVYLAPEYFKTRAQGKQLKTVEIQQSLF